MTANTPPAFMRPTQQHLWSAENSSCTLFCPQSGKTAAGLHWLLGEAVAHPGGLFWYISQVYTQSRESWRRLRAGLPNTRFIASPLEAQLPNGSIIQFKTAANPEGLYGPPISAFVADECDKMDDDAFAAIQSRTAYTGGKQRWLGNRTGRNLFIRWCDDETFPTYRMTGPQAVDAGIMAADRLTVVKASMPEIVYRELYLLENVQAANPFLRYRERIADEPSTEPTTAAGIDVAYSPDWYAVAGIDADGRWTLDDAWQQLPFEESAARAYSLIGGAIPTLVDETNERAHVEQLARAGVRAAGYRFTSESRQALLENLALAITRDECSISPAVAKQLAEFEVSYTSIGVKWQSRDKKNVGDDRVMAAALALWQQRRKPDFGVGLL